MIGDALLTDQYTLTMAQSFWRHGQAHERTSFELFVRRLPPDRGYLVAAGLRPALEYLREWRFSDRDLDHLFSLGIFDSGFLRELSELSFTGDVWAVPEGTALPAQAPILRVEAPRLEAAIVESALLSIVNHQTMIATKAARIASAARGRAVWDFSLRRLHGPDAAFGVARAAYIAGFAGTATVAAGRELGIPTTGTMAHHFVQSFGVEREQQAFEQFLRDYPQMGVLLVDTYDAHRGIERAIAAAKATGVRLRGLRLDSGDLAALARYARRRLDEEGMTDAMVLASNDLDEYRITELLAAGAPIDAFGVGTMLGTCADAPALGGVYKLVAQETADERPGEVMKMAVGKRTDPGRHQLWRAAPDRFLLGMADEEGPQGLEPLLRRVMRWGSLAEREDLDRIRARCARELDALPADVRALHEPREIELRRTPALERLIGEIAEPAAAASA